MRERIDYHTPVGVFVADVPRLLDRKEADETARCQQLVADCVALESVPEVAVPAWDPPELDELQKDVDAARTLLINPSAGVDWDDATVWRAMYERTRNIAEDLLDLASRLDDKLREVSSHDDHNKALAQISAAAKRIQCDLGW